MSVPYRIALLCVLAGDGSCLRLSDVDAQSSEIRILGVTPQENVPLDAPVEVLFSARIEAFDAEDGPTKMLFRGDEGSQTATASVERNANEDGVLLYPQEKWPPGRRLTPASGSSLQDALGQPLRDDAGLLWFSTADAASAPDDPWGVRIESPAAGEIAPINLAYVHLRVSSLETLSEAELVSDADRVMLKLTSPMVSGGAVTQWEVGDGACDGLCPATEYRLVWPGSRPPEPGFDRVRTASTADNLAPELLESEAIIEGPEVVLRLVFSEPATIRPLSAEESDNVFEGPPAPSRQMALHLQQAVMSGVAYRYRFVACDLSDNCGEPVEMPFQVPDIIQARFTELVTTPLRDWGDSLPRGQPFDPFPGLGSVTDADEWVEIVNLAPHPVQVRGSGLRIDALDRSPSVTFVEGAAGLYFGGGGSLEAWLPNEPLVVRLRGSMSSTGLTLRLQHGRVLLHQVVLDAASSGDHPGGAPPDALRESLSRDPSGRLRWCVPSPGAWPGSLDCL
jgi:hypothetical protein